jgi:hypothetical protein
MINQHTIQISKADNGFIILSQGDQRPKNGKFIATTQEEVVTRVRAIADGLFTPVTATGAPPSVPPAAPPAKTDAAPA